MKTHHLTPDPACPFCRGSGEIEERHPYGSTTATEYLICDCILEQLPEDCEEDAIEIVRPGIGEPDRMIVRDGPEFEYDDYL
jgi:hypothetical protein